MRVVRESSLVTRNPNQFVFQPNWSCQRQRPGEPLSRVQDLSQRLVVLTAFQVRVVRESSLVTRIPNQFGFQPNWSPTPEAWRATLTCPRSIAAAGRTNSVPSDSGTRVLSRNSNPNQFDSNRIGPCQRQRPGEPLSLVQDLSQRLVVLTAFQVTVVRESSLVTRIPNQFGFQPNWSCQRQRPGEPLSRVQIYRSGWSY